MNKEPLIYRERRGTDCLKWDGMERNFGRSDLMALWVADMDFEAPAGVTAAVRTWAEHGIYGYYWTPDGYYDSFIAWEHAHHGYIVERDWLRYSPGIVTGIYWLLLNLTQPGDGIAVLTPVYYPFFHAIEDTGRRLNGSPLINNNGIYSIDFANLDETLAKSKVLILSSPHNPVGRVWTPEELKQIGELCKKHNVYIISDEIHQDLVLGEKRHHPTATVTDAKVVTLASASKTFNLAGLSNAFVILPDAELREKFDAFQKEHAFRGGASVGYIAARAAFETGEPWLESLLDQVRENYTLIHDSLADKLPKAVVAPLEGTYLMWIDLRAYVAPEQIKEVMEQKCGLAVDYGEWFGFEDYRSFIRINLATRTENARLAVERLSSVLGK